MKRVLGRYDRGLGTESGGDMGTSGWTARDGHEDAAGERGAMAAMLPSANKRLLLANAGDWCGDRGAFALLLGLERERPARSRACVRSRPAIR